MEFEEGQRKGKTGLSPLNKIKNVHICDVSNEPAF